MATEGNHQRFLQHLSESGGAVWEVAMMLQDRGYFVSVAPTSKAARHEDWKQHADQGDLFISQRVEVKRLGVDFTGQEDWPFGDKFIVCAKHSFDRAFPRPYAYVILSSSGQYAATVFTSDCDKWTVEQRTDKRYENVSQEFYFCPFHLVRFFRMPSVGKTR